MEPTTAYLLGSALIAGLSALGNWEQNKANKEIMEKQQQWNEDMMDKQNEYNTPSNQLQRLNDAGIPAGSLGMQSSGVNVLPSASANPTSLLPYVDPMTTASNNLLSVASAFNQGSSGRERESLLALRKEQIARQNEVLLKTAEGMGLSNEAQSIVLKYTDAREQWSLQETKSRVWKNLAEKRNLNVLSDEAAYRIKEVLPQEVQESISRQNLYVFDADKILYEIKDLEANVKLKQAQTGTEQAKKELVQAQTVTEGLKQEQISAETGFTEQQSDYYARQADKYLEKLDAEIGQISENTNLTHEQVYWYTFDEMSKWKDNTMLGSLLNAKRQKQVIKTANKKARQKGDRVYHPSGHEAYSPDRFVR